METVAEEATQRPFWTLGCEGRQGSESKESEVKGLSTSQRVTKGEPPCGKGQHLGMLISEADLSLVLRLQVWLQKTGLSEHCPGGMF